MLYRGVMCLCFFVVLVAPAFSAERSSEIREYTVHGGDTLWAISGKELKDTFLWPKVWKENPGIMNPDRIFPGQQIRIPLYLLNQEKQDGPLVSNAPSERAESAAADAGGIRQPSTAGPVVVEERIVFKPLIGKNLLMSSGYIADSISNKGKIYGAPDERILFGDNDIVYIKAENPVKAGDRFYVIRPGAEVKHPVSGKRLGQVVEIRGIIEIARFEYGETKARIVQAFDDIVVGDRLDTYHEVNPPLTSGSFRKPDIKGTVVATQNLKNINGNLDIVYIDKGQRDGVEIGDLLQTLIIGNHTIPNSIIQVINYRDTTATAIVRSFDHPVATGNVFVKAE